MSKFDYIKAQTTALRLIDKFGQRTPIVRILSDYDPVSGAPSNGNYYLTNTTVVSLPASGQSAEKFDNRFREDLKQGKIRFFYLAAKGAGFEPKPGDKIFFEGDSWEIGGSTPLNPGGKRVLSTIGCRLGDKNHLGDELKAIAEMGEGEEITPEIIDRIKKEGCCFLLDVVEFTFGLYRYMVGEFADGQAGLVNRWEIGVGDAGSADWAGTKPSTQTELEALTYS